jgi:hypothetical protein
MLKNFSMTRGDSSAYTLTFTQANGTPYNITGWLITFTLKTSYDIPDAQKTFQKIVSVHTDPTNGISILALLPADTAMLPSRIYDFDIVVQTTSGDIYTLLKGKFTLEYDVTWGTAGTTP